MLNKLNDISIKISKLSIQKMYLVVKNDVQNGGRCVPGPFTDIIEAEWRIYE